MTNQQNVPSNKKGLMYSDVIANLNALFQERSHRNVSDQFADTKPAVLGTGEPVFQNNRRTEVLVW